MKHKNKNFLMYLINYISLIVLYTLKLFCQLPWDCLFLILLCFGIIMNILNYYILNKWYHVFACSMVHAVLPAVGAVVNFIYYESGDVRDSISILIIIVAGSFISSVFVTLSSIITLYKLSKTANKQAYNKPVKYSLFAGITLLNLVPSLHYCLLPDFWQNNTSIVIIPILIGAIIINNIFFRNWYTYLASSLSFPLLNFLIIILNNYFSTAAGETSVPFSEIFQYSGLLSLFSVYKQFQNMQRQIYIITKTDYIYFKISYVNKKLYAI